MLGPAFVEMEAKGREPVRKGCLVCMLGEAIGQSLLRMSPTAMGDFHSS